MPCVKKLKTVENRPRNSKFTEIGLLGQKRADIFRFKILVQNSPRDYEFLEISVFCQKREDNNILTKYSQNIGLYSQNIGL